MDLINVLLHNPINIGVSIAALGLAGYAAMVARDNKREIRHHKQIDEALHGQMLSKVDDVKDDLEAFTKKWDHENERDRNQRGEMWSALSSMKSDVAYLKGRAEQADSSKGA